MVANISESLLALAHSRFEPIQTEEYIRPGSAFFLSAYDKRYELGEVTQAAHVEALLDKLGIRYREHPNMQNGYKKLEILAGDPSSNFCDFIVLYATRTRQQRLPDNDRYRNSEVLAKDILRKLFTDYLKEDYGITPPGPHKPGDQFKAALAGTFRRQGASPSLAVTLASFALADIRHEQQGGRPSLVKF